MEAQDNRGIFSKKGLAKYACLNQRREYSVPKYNDVERRLIRRVARIKVGGDLRSIHRQYNLAIEVQVVFALLI